MRLRLDDKIFDVQIAQTPEELQIGLSQTDKLTKSEGLLLKFPELADHPIRMSDMKFGLDLVFLNGGSVIKAIPAEAGSEDVVLGKPSDSVLEIKSGQGADIHPGATLEVVGEKNEDGTVTAASGGIEAEGPRQLLDEDGKNQMNLIGGERIFARSVTEKLFKYAKSEEYKKLGKVMVDDINKQDTQKPEYAEN